MIKRLALALLFVSISASAQTTTFIANLKDLATNTPANPEAGPVYLELSLRNVGTATVPTLCRVNGVGVVSFPINLYPVSGVVSATVYDETFISCGGSTGVAYYHIRLYQGDSTRSAIKKLLFEDDFDVEGATFNLNSAAPRSAAVISPPPATAVLTNPSGNQTIVQPGGTALSVNRLSAGFAQSSNGTDMIPGQRFTDTSPTGNFLNFKNAAGSTPLWEVDVTGTLLAGIIPNARLSTPPATGTGTTNKITKFTNGPGGAIGDSGLTDNGTTISTSEAVSAANITTTSGTNTFGGPITAGSNSITGGAFTGTSLNGIGLTASSTIQSIITAACNGTVPGTSWAPLGNTTGQSSITVPANCTFKCPSPRACSITAVNNYGTNFIFATGANITIEGIIIDCDKATQSGQGACVRGTNVTNFHVEGNIIQNAKQNLVTVDGTTNSGIWIQNNLIQHTTAGNGIIVGNTPASQGGADAAASNVNIKNNEIHDINGTADGIFTIGEIASSGYGIVGGDISGNIIDTFPDTAIEVGEGSKGFAVVHNIIDVPASIAGGVGISTRSASNVQVSSNEVTCHSPVVVQDGIFAWHCTGGSCGGGVSDPPTEQFINIDINTVQGCATGGGNDYQANSGDNIHFSGNKSSNVAASYFYNAGVTNLTHCGNDDNQCSGNNGNDFTVDPGSSHFEHMGRNMGISNNGTVFNPNAPVHVQTGGNFADMIVEATVDTNEGISEKNSVQQWSHGVRQDTSESWVLRDITHGVNTLTVATTTGNISTPGTYISNGKTLPVIIASGTAPMTTAAIASGACGTTVTVAATGVATTDVIDVARNAAVTTPNGLLTLNWWPTSGNVNFNYCNPTAASQTPVAATLNWAVKR